MSDLERMGPIGFDPKLLDEQPRNTIEEMCVGRQITRLSYLGDGNRYGGAQAGLRLRDSARPIFLAAPGAYLAELRKLPSWPFRWAVALDFLERLTIISPRVEMELRMGRHKPGSEDPPDEVQRRVEGEVILGIPPQHEPTKDGGERIKLELTGGINLWIEGEPGQGVVSQRNAEGGWDQIPVTAGLFMWTEDHVQREVIVFGKGTGRPRR